MRSASATEVPPNFLTINLPIKKASILYYWLFNETIKSATEVKAKSKVNTETEARAKAEAKANVKAKAKANANAEAKADVKAKVKAKASKANFESQTRRNGGTAPKWPYHF